MSEVKLPNISQRGQSQGMNRTNSGMGAAKSVFNAAKERKE